MGVLPLSSGLWTQDAGNLLPYEMMVGEARGEASTWRSGKEGGPGGQVGPEGPRGGGEARGLCQGQVR